MIETIRLTGERPAAEVEALAGTQLGPDSFDRLIASACDVYRPDGELLLAYRPGVLPASACAAAYPALRSAASESFNRGVAAGEIRDAAEAAHEVAEATRTRYRPRKGDGTVSNTSYAKPVRSGIVGYFDRAARTPYCRLTAFNLARPERFEAALPFIRAVDRAFAATVPARHAAQMEVVRRTSPDYVIHGTAFTTITVNRNWQTAVHRDAGDLRAGFGVMAALRAGRFDGCYLCFPRFRVAVDMRTGGVLMADVHEFHGNTPFVGVPGGFDRVSCVFYYRENMIHCGSAAEELERAKRRRPGDPING